MPPPPPPLSQTFKNGIKNDHPVLPVAAAAASSSKAHRDRRMVKARRALKTFVVSVGTNLTLTMAIILLFGSGKRFNARPKPMWSPPLWLVHAASLGSSFFMGLASWLVWAEGGFGAQSEALPLYLAGTSLGIVWDPLVLVMGADWVGLAFCLVHLGTLVACKREFGKVNPLAGDIVRPCVVWVGFLTIFTFSLAIS
ncbi:translocator protein homolog [Rhodamnia argentea]|uniref:Translocator protein homolog n=1 Tax=Rhodamnia argentea TaxID=178133 RepID=A0A8B8MN26_9MYRT|nr:translocator protein homolog [Rhodamnia argentea]